ncbi:MAG: carboxypeptidase-like regulatory domain-containing protein [Rubricoccaceae bacterium]|nr:carboxypeptidase-like regulatory domain-containing protein [Rubricoccaceae bacterium]
MHLRLLLALLSVGLAGCLADAERGNPFDPLSDAFDDDGEVVGVVVRASRPSEGVAGARIRLQPEGGGVEVVAVASADGSFRVPDVEPGPYALTVEAPGYTPADTALTVAPAQPTPPLVLSLDALPLVLEQRVHTEQINRFYPPPQMFTRLVVAATVADPDGLGDVAAVDLVIPDFDGFRAPLLAVSGEEGAFARTFTEDELPVGLQDLLGRNLYIEVTDQQGATSRGDDAHVTRIVESTPEAVFPQTIGQDLVAPPFTMSWEAFSLPYAFTWRIEIFLVPTAGQSVPVLTLDEIPSDRLDVTITEGMATFVPGNYQWFVSAVDAFGNLARSFEAGFTVPPN